jgi:hypothetical protein
MTKIWYPILRDLRTSYSGVSIASSEYYILLTVTHRFILRPRETRELNPGNYYTSYTTLPLARLDANTNCENKFTVNRR